MNKSETLGGPLTEDGRYRLLVDSITDYAIYMLDVTGDVINWNAGAQRLKGYTAEEIVGRNFTCFYRSEDRQKGLPAAALATAAAEGKFETEGWRVRKDGSTFLAHVVIDPVMDEAGELIGFAKITRDLSERAEAEKTLKRSEEQFRLLVQSVTDYAIFMLDAQGYVSSWNAGAERIKGYKPGEIIGEHFSRFYSADDRASGEPQRALAAAQYEGRFSKEGWRYRKDGSRFWASVVIDPIRNDDGALVGFAKITRDLTEREEAQRELERAREALFQAQKMEAIGQLTGGVAHDFNNLLMATLSSLELLRKRVVDDPQALRLLDNATQGARRGASLTQRMLAFARRQDLKPVRVEIPMLIRGMTDLINRSLGPSINVETRFPLSLDAVTADINQMEMALLNLVVNARDAMPQGGEITIAAEERMVGPGAKDGLAPGRYVSLSVTDSGEGMDGETLSRAMEPFFTTKGVGKGTGLGLSMVHGLAEQSGGRFFLESEPGKGTTAALWLPIAPSGTLSAGAIPEASPPSGTRPLTVLAVDDDGLVLMNTVALLEDMGHLVFEASSGDEALAIFEREPGIDLVITDQAMPNMTGVQFAEQAMARRPGVPFILATGYGELPPGADPAMRKLGKPFSQADLERAISDLFNAPAV
ncbi:hybrid sensor histidine kinase/response regulator [Rhizorhabdus argentea]|uniref:hybrid sensor histidine kinase/response regulator n=1 Tax=Rhizorhabdus argentea TaxID=1387174 RepID=UPI0030EED8CD